MKTRIFRLSIAVVVALIGLILFGAMVSWAAPAQNAAAEIDMTQNDPRDAVIRARKATTIPFGIDDSLLLSEDGRHIVVTGHGTCQAGGDTYRIRVTVDQDSPSTRAKGHTEGDCEDGATLSWEAVAQAQGPKIFDEGEAQVCAMAIVFVPRGGAVTQQWCKDVTLE